MFQKILLLVFNMIDFFDIIHYLIGLIIVGFLIWIFIKIHLYFSKNNIPIEPVIDKPV
jgi:ATP/ADP translocase